MFSSAGDTTWIESTGEGFLSSCASAKPQLLFSNVSYLDSVRLVENTGSAALLSNASM